MKCSDDVLRLYAHMEWADALIWSCVLSSRSLSEDAFVRKSLHHLHRVQRAYLTGWMGGTPVPSAKDDFPSIEALRVWARTFYPDVRAFLDSLTDGDLSARPPLLWPDMVERAIGQPPVSIALGDMVYQVVAHSTHHRAQVSRRLRELGAEPPFSDFVAWAWMDDPAATWD